MISKSRINELLDKIYANYSAIHLDDGHDSSASLMSEENEAVAQSKLELVIESLSDTEFETFNKEVENTLKYIAKLKLTGNSIELHLVVYPYRKTNNIIQAVHQIVQFDNTKEFILNCGAINNGNIILTYSLISFTVHKMSNSNIKIDITGLNMSLQKLQHRLSLCTCIIKTYKGDATTYMEGKPLHYSKKDELIIYNLDNIEEFLSISKETEFPTYELEDKMSLILKSLILKASYGIHTDFYIDNDTINTVSRIKLLRMSGFNEDIVNLLISKTQAVCNCQIKETDTLNSKNEIQYTKEYKEAMYDLAILVESIIVNNNKNFGPQGYKHCRYTPQERAKYDSYFHKVQD